MEGFQSVQIRPESDVVWCGQAGDRQRVGIGRQGGQYIVLASNACCVVFMLGRGGGSGGGVVLVVVLLGGY